MWKLPRGLEIWRYCKASKINNFKKFWVLFGSLSFIERLIALRSLFFLYLLLLLVTSTLLCIIDLSFKFLNILTSNQILFYLPTSSRGYALHFFFFTSILPTVIDLFIFLSSISTLSSLNNLDYTITPPQTPINYVALTCFKLDKTLSSSSTDCHLHPQLNIAGEKACSHSYWFTSL